MKHIKQFLFLALLAFIGTGQMWGETYVMFSGTTFNSNWDKTSRTQRATYPSSGANSKTALQMMKLNSGTYGEISSKSTFTSISAISVNCANSTAQKLTLFYSSDKSTWTQLSQTNIAQNTTSYSDCNLTITGIPSTAVYIKLRAESNSLYLYSVTITTSGSNNPTLFLNHSFLSLDP